MFGIVAIGYFLSRNKTEAIAVRTDKVSLRTITQKVNAIGTLHPETEVKISSEASGEIILLPIMEGDTVKKGQLLAKIKPDIIETQVEQYRAALNASKTDIDYQKSTLERAEYEFNRVRDLYEKQYVAKQDLDRAKTTLDQSRSQYQNSLARYEQAQASLKQIQKSADRTTIVSPIDGIVTALNVELGEKVLGTIQNIGTEMMRISDLSIMNTKVDVDENDIVLISVGDTANIDIDAFPNRIFKGIVKEIGHSAKVTSQASQDQVTNFEVKIRLLDLDPKMRPGMSCNVDIETETHYNVLSVPLQSVTVRVGEGSNKDENQSRIRKVENENNKIKSHPQSVVFVVDNNKVNMVKVETGISDEGFIEIKTGLKEGEDIVVGSFTAISKKLEDGSKIKIENADNKKGKMRRKK
ncbi:efflux RND transporter periplasmic adaptor subunit [bacterium]|nr:MAG: efflux RND transporter periplasmic adaptor subunit [bacterium]